MVGHRGATQISIEVCLLGDNSDAAEQVAEPVNHPLQHGLAIDEVAGLVGAEATALAPCQHERLGREQILHFTEAIKSGSWLNRPVRA